MIINYFLLRVLIRIINGINYESIVDLGSIKIRPILFFYFNFSNLIALRNKHLRLSAMFLYKLRSREPFFLTG